MGVFKLLNILLTLKVQNFIDLLTLKVQIVESLLTLKVQDFSIKKGCKPLR